MSVTKDTGRALYTARQQELGPNRLRAVARAYVKDVEPYPFSHVDLAPGPVQDAYETFQRVIDQVDATIAAAEDEQQKAQQSFARGAAGRSRPGRRAGAQASSMPTAAGGERFQVMEEAIGTAHGALVEVVEAHWAEWRAKIHERLAADRATALEAWETAKAAVGQALAGEDAMLDLDEAVRRHSPTLHDQTDKERRCGLQGWYSMTHIVPPRFDKAAEGVDGFLKHFGTDLEAWVPPGDPRREELLNTPPDPELPWVRRAAFESLEWTCRVCGQSVSRDSNTRLVLENGTYSFSTRALSPRRPSPGPAPGIDVLRWGRLPCAGGVYFRGGLVSTGPPFSPGACFHGALSFSRGLRS